MWGFSSRSKIPCFYNDSNYLCFRGHSSFFLPTKQAGGTAGKAFRSICCLLFCTLQRICLFTGPSFCNMLKSKAVSREAARGYIPQCEGDSGGFSPVQCSQDQESCWCVFDSGEEVPGTRVSGGRPECASEFLLQAFYLWANPGLEFNSDPKFFHSLVEFNLISSDL